MDPKLFKEILAAHADQLAKGDNRTRDYLELVPEQENELAPLLQVAERVKSILEPIAPADSFEAQLKRDLLAVAHMHRVQGYTPPDPSRGLLILAGIFAFLVSLASLLVALRLRSQGT